MGERLLSRYLELGSVGDVVTQARPPQLSDFGGGGLRSPIYINSLTGEAFIYVNGVVTPFNSAASGSTVFVNATAYPYYAPTDGIADAYAAIQAALTNAPTGAIIVLPPGKYRISQGLVIPASKTLWGISIGQTYTLTNYPQIICDFTVPTAVTLTGGGGSDLCALRSVTVNRAVATPTTPAPAGSVGVLATTTNSSVIEDVLSAHHETCFKCVTTLGVRYNRCVSSACSGSHWWFKDTQEVHATNCRGGKNGGPNLAGNEFVRIEGACDTIKFEATNFLDTVTRALMAQDYSSANGIHTFSACHFENNTNVVAIGGTTVFIGRLSFINCTIGGTTFISAPANTLRDFTLIGSPFCTASLTLDTATRFNVANNIIVGAVLIQSGQGEFCDNLLGSTLTVQGSFTGATVCNNVLYTAAALTDTSTGQIVVANNVINDAALNKILQGEGIPWLPTLSFVTPGNLNVVCATRVGFWTQKGKLIEASFNILTSTFTHTTAAGSLIISGVGLTSTADAGFFMVGGAFWGGITKANYTQVNPYVDANSSVIKFATSGSGQAPTDIAVVDTPTGGTMRLTGTVFFRIP